MNIPLPLEARQKIEDHYKKRALKREVSPDRQQKIDRIEWIINFHRLQVDDPSLKRAKTCIVYYDREAITKSEESFLTAVIRDKDRCTLPYFFGILKRI